MEFGFYLICIYRYLVVCKGAVIINSYLGLAMLFFEHNELLALTFLFIGMMFNSLHCVVGEVVSWSIGDLLWFVMLWASTYFP